MKRSCWGIGMMVAAGVVGLGGGLWGQETGPVSPEESLRLFSVDEGYAVELVAAEPLTQDPVAIDWGLDGRLWVAEMADYPYGIDGEGRPGGRVRFLTDEDGDGVMDRSSLFLEGLSFPTSVMAWGDGVLVAAAPELIYAVDEDGDGRADRRETWLTGFMEGNQQLRFNSLRWGLDNWIYGASGGHHAGFGAENGIRVTATGEEVRIGSGDFRWEPESHRLERMSGPSQFGRVRDDWGNWFGVQNSYPLWHVVLEDRYLQRNPAVTIADYRQQLRGHQPRVFGAKAPEKRFHGFDHVGRYTSACGPSIYRDDWLFEREEGLVHAFTCEPFSNVVQHHHLRPEGATFAGERASTLSDTDFLASADRWCRPVMTRTGPDGALWVVDMYRYMIEHPDWLPESGREELKPYYRHGEDRGRIYRVVAQGKARRPIPRLAGVGAEEWVAYLASPNGVVRDAAQRMLVTTRWEAVEEAKVKGALRVMAGEHPEGRARLHAVATLSGLDCLDEDLMLGVLGDGRPEIRRLGILLAEEKEIGKREKVRSAVCALAEDEDAGVRLQLAQTLGYWPGREAGEALVRLAEKTGGDGFMTAAILSAAPLHYGRLAAAAGSWEKAEPLFEGLMRMAAVRPEEEQSVLLAAVFPEGDEVYTAEKFRLLGLWAGLGQGELKGRAGDALLAAAVEQAREVAMRSAEPVERRTAALGMLGWKGGDGGKDLPVWEICLRPQVSSEVQRAALEASARTAGDEVTALWLERWAGFTPGLRATALERFLSHEPSVERLVEGLRKGVVKAGDIQATHRERLLKARPEAEQWLTPPAGREEALASRRGALERTGVAAEGERIFAERCALCHRAGEAGDALGPDLRALTNREPEALFSAILDPNRAVDPRYLAYTAVTQKGEAVFGMLQSETGQTLTFRLMDGSARQLLRAEVASLTGAEVSVMPEGLEEGLSDQELADLIAFVQGIR